MASVTVTTKLGRPSVISEGALSLRFSVEYPPGWERFPDMLQSYLLGAVEDTGILGDAESAEGRIIALYYQLVSDDLDALRCSQYALPVELLVIPLVQALYTPLHFVCGDLDKYWIQARVAPMSTRDKLLATVEFVERFDCKAFFGSTYRVGS